MYIFLADTLLVVHALVVVFVLLGFVFITAGIFRQWAWIANFWFRCIHLVLIGTIAAKSWLGMLCPLTLWESRLRTMGGESGYPSSFILYWLQRVIYYDYPLWIFALIYSLFTGLVLVTWIVRPPKWPRLFRRE
jgi:polyferredoxin